MDATVLAVFVFVYLGMVLGRLPGMALDRTGIALLGAIALLVTERVTPEQAWRAIDVPTIGLLFGLMVVSAQFRLGGFYAAVTRRISARPWHPPALLAAFIGVVGLLSALLANDIVCLAVAPLIIETCARRQLRPYPFLLALACAANVGSAATLIGNPQNMLIGQTLRLSFAGYLADAVAPSVLGLAVVWVVIAHRFRGRWSQKFTVPPAPESKLDRWQAAKGLVILAALVGVFLCTAVPREVAAMAAAGLILLSRRMHTRQMLALVDWQLLVLFIALFVVNDALQASGMLARTTESLTAAGVEVRQPTWLFAVTVVLSNLVSNVPAVMLLLPVATHTLAGPILALASTLAGNLFIVGSIANIIVVDQAERYAVRLTWREHARVGVPVTVLTLAIAAGWLALRAG